MWPGEVYGKRHQRRSEGAWWQSNNKWSQIAWNHDSEPEITRLPLLCSDDPDPFNLA